MERFEKELAKLNVDVDVYKDYLYGIIMDESIDLNEKESMVKDILTEVVEDENAIDPFVRQIRDWYGTQESKEEIIESEHLADQLSLKLKAEMMQQSSQQVKVEMNIDKLKILELYDLAQSDEENTEQMENRNKKHVEHVKSAQRTFAKAQHANKVKYEKDLLKADKLRKEQKKKSKQTTKNEKRR